VHHAPLQRQRVRRAALAAHDLLSLRRRALLAAGVRR
jgi:hypothetical protein